MNFEPDDSNMESLSLFELKQMVSMMAKRLDFEESEIPHSCKRHFKEKPNKNII